MTYTLKNKDLEIDMDAPLENYNFSRFDWTGKITQVKFKGVLVSSTERTDGKKENFTGKGFYNEFGIDFALGFEDAAMGEWFHKIGVGALKKDGTKYSLHNNYEIRPANFKVVSGNNKITIICTAELINGYGYVLHKEIELHDTGFSINYNLENTGDKEIITDEYTHNFTLLDNDAIGQNYTLNFPFPIKPHLFEETVNPEQKVEIGLSEIQFNDSPDNVFFFSNLTGNETCDASWELKNLKNNIGIRETGNFKTKKVNLWGAKHVICPELFIEIAIKPGQSKKWTRNYTVFKF